MLGFSAVSESPPFTSWMNRSASSRRTNVSSEREVGREGVTDDDGFARSCAARSLSEITAWSREMELRHQEERGGRMLLRAPQHPCAGCNRGYERPGLTRLELCPLTQCHPDRRGDEPETVRNPLARRLDVGLDLSERMPFVELGDFECPELG